MADFQWFHAATAIIFWLSLHLGARKLARLADLDKYLSPEAFPDAWPPSLFSETVTRLLFGIPVSVTVTSLPEALTVADPIERDIVSTALAVPGEAIGMLY